VEVSENLLVIANVTLLRSDGHTLQAQNMKRWARAESEEGRRRGKNEEEEEEKEAERRR